jgi:hypothetical protein
MERVYTDKGFISKFSTLNVLGNDSKFSLLLPVSGMPETRTAPDQVDKTVLSDGGYTYAEGLQGSDTKQYTFNYHRDNVRALKKVKGKELTFLERNPDNTGERYKGTLTYSRNSLAVNGIVQGTIYITVSSADEDAIDDVRDLVKPTAIITTPLNDVVVDKEGTYEVQLETSPNATVTATSSSASIATASIVANKLTITGVAKGFAMVELTVSATGEATSYRTIAVEVTGV